MIISLLGMHLSVSYPLHSLFCCCLGLLFLGGTCKAVSVGLYCMLLGCVCVYMHDNLSCANDYFLLVCICV